MGWPNLSYRLVDPGPWVRRETPQQPVLGGKDLDVGISTIKSGAMMINMLFAYNDYSCLTLEQVALLLHIVTIILLFVIISFYRLNTKDQES